MKICISQATTMPSSFADDVRNFAAAGWRAMEVWLTKLETHLRGATPAETAQLIEDHQLTLPAGSYQGGLLLSQGAQRQAHFDHFKRRLQLCHSFSIPTLILVADFVERPDHQDLERAIVSLHQAARLAGEAGIRLGLEFHGRDTFCSSLDTALALVTQCGEPNLGVSLDVFHYYTGPSKLEDVLLLNGENLVHVQLCDLAGIPRELAQDSDRILPGEGDFQLDPILDHLRAINYDSWVSLELFNPALWQAPPSQTAELGLAALQRTVASPGRKPRP